MNYNPDILAYTYDSGSYGASTYERSTTAQTGATSGGGTSSAAGGVLTNTGFDILLAATLACAIIFVALLVRFWKRPRTNTPSEGDVA